jgi:hypothetical protein
MEWGFRQEERGGIILWIEGDRELFSGTRTVEISHPWKKQNTPNFILFIKIKR